MEITKTENRKTIESMKPEVGSLKRSTELTNQENKRETQITKHINESGIITTDLRETGL